MYFSLGFKFLAFGDRLLMTVLCSNNFILDNVICKEYFVISGSCRSFDSGCSEVA